MQTVDPKGIAWTVKRRWLPRYEGRGLRQRLRQRPRRPEKRKSDRQPRWYDWLDFPDIADSITVAILVILAVILLVLFGIPLLLAFVDLVVVLGATVSGVVARVVFRRPWIVEARSEKGENLEVRVVGWRRAGATVDRVARNIQFGLPYDREGMDSS